jgi:uncharacterized protein GlcG (DUF336 family)
MLQGEIDTMRISYPIARILGSIAEKKASAMAVPMAIALADREGSLLFLGRMDDTLPASSEIATSKAYTAAALRMATHEVGELAQPGKVLYGIQHNLNGKIVLFAGGLPLLLNGEVVGAIGISGGTVEEDLEVAESVVNALRDMEGWSEQIREFLPASPLDKRWIFQLEEKLGEAFGQIDHPLPHEIYSILTGAILLADGANQ